MLLTFILGALAGFAVPYVEPHVASAVARVAPENLPLTEVEVSLLTLVGLLLVAALVTGGVSSLSLLAGALVGVFGPRIIAAVQGRSR